jgi:SpoVK/Ycf46/Vps4 family AAA+-type ATPase
MTTNFPEKLDPAILREGRTDLKIFLENADSEQIHGMFSKFFPCDEEDITLEEAKDRFDCANEFVEIIPSKTQSMAAIQAFLIEHWHDCRNAIDEAKIRMEEHGQIADPIEIFKVQANFRNKDIKNAHKAPPNSMSELQKAIANGNISVFTMPPSLTQSGGEVEAEDEYDEDYDENYDPYDENIE